MLNRAALLGLTALALGGAVSAHASVSQGGTTQAITVSPVMDYSTYFCRYITASREFHDAAGVTLAKVWNHSKSCYRYAQQITSRWVQAPPDTYTAPGWNSNNRISEKGWWSKPHSWWSSSRAHFWLSVGGYTFQEWNGIACIVMTDRGGVAWCP